MRRALLALVVLSIPANRTLAQRSPSFADGVADRTTWEDWFADTGGDFHAGAEFWATHRSDPDAGCRSNGPPKSDQWIAGCEEAQQRLARFISRLKVDPGYRQGWNSVTDKPPAPPSVPPASVPISPVLPRKGQPRIPVPGPAQ